MSIDRLKVLQMLSDGSIDAVTASKILSGEASMPTADGEEVDAESAEEVIVEEEPAVEKQPEIVVQVASSTQAQPNKVVHIEIDETPQPEDEPLPDHHVHVVIKGEPVKADLNFTVPGKLFKLGTQLGAYFKPELDVDDLEAINISFSSDTQHVHIYTEQVA